MATSFNSGFQLGANMYNNAERVRLAQEQVDLAREQDARAAEKHALDMKGLRRIDDAMQGLTNLQTYGAAIPENQAANQALQRDSLRRFEIGQQNYGEEAPAYVAPTGLQPSFRQPTRLEMNNAIAALAGAKGDTTSLAALDDRGFKLQGEDETRAFLEKGRQLYSNRTKSEQDMQAWVDFARPHTQMVSGFKGIDMDALVDPKTGVIKVVPYGSNKLQEASFEQAMPYLLKSYQLTSQFGSPEAALEALNKMSAEERKTLMEGTNFRFGMADKQSQSINRDRTSRAAETTAGAAAKNADTNAAWRASQQIQPIGLTEDRTGLVFRDGDNIYTRPLPPGTAGLFPKVTGEKGSGAAGIKYQADNVWLDIEKKLRQDNTPPQQIKVQRDSFYAQYGIAPQSEIKVLYSGRDESGKKLTAEDVAAFRQVYPNTEIDEAQLKWLKPAPTKNTGTPDAAAGYTPPPGSPAAKAALNRQKAAEQREQAYGLQRERLRQATERSAKTMSATPSDRFEIDRKTMSPAELRREYGNGAGLTDEQFIYMMR